jgi:hypothetical protein
LITERQGRSIVYIDIKQYYQQQPAKPGKKKNKKAKQSRPPWQASNASIIQLMGRSAHRPVPGDTCGNIDQPIGFNDDGPTLCIKGSADWIHMIGPIGIYYIHQLDIHPTYQSAFSALLWWMFKLRRRYTIKSELDESEPNSLPHVGRECLAVLEHMMPNAFCTILFHLLQHACSVLSFTGPPHGTWMFVFERWVQIAKGLLHSPYSAAVGVMKAVMTHEWLTFSQYKTQQHLDQLLTPPLDRHEQHPVIQVLGIPKLIKLDQLKQADSLFRKTFVFLLQNDPVMQIVNDVFNKRYQKQAKNGGKVIDDWTPHADDFAAIRSRIQMITNKDITMEEVKQVIRGPTIVKSYDRMRSNLTSFSTQSYEAKNPSRCTRKMIKYKSDKGKHAYAHIEQIITLLSHDAMNFAKEYTLLIIHNWKPVMKGPKGHQSKIDHPCGLPHLSKVSKQENVFQCIPVIAAEVVYPYNVAAWPASGVASDSGNYLIVQQHVITDETTL